MAKRICLLLCNKGEYVFNRFKWIKYIYPQSKWTILIRSLIILKKSSGILLSITNLRDWLLIIKKFNPNFWVESYWCRSISAAVSILAHRFHILSVYARQGICTAKLISLILVFWLSRRIFLLSRELIPF
jgi:hypothetical protein